MRTIVGVAVMAILVSIVVVGTIAVTDEVDARGRRGSESVHFLDPQVDSTPPYAVQMWHMHAKRLMDNSII